MYAETCTLWEGQSGRCTGRAHIIKRSKATFIITCIYPMYSSRTPCPQLQFKQARLGFCILLCVCETFERVENHPS
jgi:hypothetical protein